MDFRHLIVTCLFSMLRLPFDNQKVKENYAIFTENIRSFSLFWEIKFHFLDNSLFISLLLLYYSVCLRLVCCGRSAYLVYMFPIKHTVFTFQS